MNKIAVRTVELNKGHVDVYEKNGITLYAYQTHDLIDDEVFVLARSGRGVVIELPCFFDNIRELTDFLAREGIQVEAKLVAYHAAGPSCRRFRPMVRPPLSPITPRAAAQRWFPTLKTRSARALTQGFAAWITCWKRAR